MLYGEYSSYEDYCASFGVEEEWRAINGFEGYYEISNWGRVKSLARQIKKSRKGKPFVTWYGEKIIKPHYVKRQSILTQLWRDEVVVQRLVHHLVLEAFREPRPDGKECCHNNGQAWDNRVENLRWDTHQSNMDDRVVHGTLCMGSKKPNAAFVEDDVREIRLAYVAGSGRRKGNVRVLAERYGVTEGTIQDIVYRRSWKHVD